MNSYLHRLNKFGTLTTVVAHIAFLGAVPFQALYPLVTTSPTEGRVTTANASQVPISLNNVDTAGHIVNWRPVSDEHLVTATTFNYEGTGDQAFFLAAMTPEAVSALLSPAGSATEANTTAAQPSPEKTGQITFTDIPGGIIAASTIILTLVIVLALGRRSPSTEE